MTEKKIIRERDAMSRYSLGRSKVREIAEKCGAVVHIDRAFRIDQSIMDAYIDNLRKTQQKETEDTNG